MVHNHIQTLTFKKKEEKKKEEKKKEEKKIAYFYLLDKAK